MLYKCTGFSNSCRRQDAFNNVKRVCPKFIVRGDGWVLVGNTMLTIFVVVNNVKRVCPKFIVRGDGWVLVGNTMLTIFVVVILVTYSNF